MITTNCSERANVCVHALQCSVGEQWFHYGCNKIMSSNRAQWSTFFRRLTELSVNFTPADLDEHPIEEFVSYKELFACLVSLWISKRSCFPSN
ncbi:hypothetical protein AHF37_05922 [Paragonimus kellicotti]|nr:hypothetical protein AHF37_05922 [Paragonimus kellicotti]